MRKVHLFLLSPVLALLIATTACQHHGQSAAGTAPVVRSPITPAPSTTITSKKTGANYDVFHSDEADHDFEKFELPPAGVAAPSPDNFHGTDRKTAKTSISSASETTFADVASLLNSKLFVKDSKMLQHNPPISKDASSGRVKEEEHNVVITGFLYASTKESDNDFHCIVGTAQGGTPRFVNVEVSGLPASGPDRQRLAAARAKFKEFFGDKLPSGKGYSKFNPPIKVRITGSIFFDVDHKAGVIGPQGFRPKTAWEIHPVTDIEFEP